MEVIMKCLVLSLMTGISCNAFFGTLLSGKGWTEKLPLPAFAAGLLSTLSFGVGFMLISVSEAPGYLLQPLRVILILCVVIQIFYQAGIRMTILLTVFWCAIYWALNLLAVAMVYALPGHFEKSWGMSDWFCNILFLCLSLFFHQLCKGWSDRWEEKDLSRFAWLPVLSLIVTTLMSITVWYTNTLNKIGVMVVAVGYSVINVLIFYFIGSVMEKERKVREAQLMQDRLENQMEMIENIQEKDMRYRRLLHDYKNQLACIQGMLKEGQTEEALGYIEELNGSIRKGEDYVNTNHPVVNTVLNQKYLRGQEKGISLVMAVNDLSNLTMGREDIVTLLVNLLDNAIEACEKVDENKVIQFKMMLEEGQLTISVRNPVKEKALVKGKRIPTTKKEKGSHGLGMLNINGVIEKNNGISILECEDGWFYFSAVIPDVL